MRAKKAQGVPAAGELAWLSHVQEVRHPINHTRQLWLRHLTSAPAVSFPEQHPYCEFNFNFAGSGTIFIGAEKIPKRSGDILVMGPGIPHYAEYAPEQQRSVTIHFAPMLLLEMGPEGDGARLLSRFTAAQSIRSRVVRPDAKMHQLMTDRFEQMIVEFESKAPGAEIKVRALMVESLVDLFRWEDSDHWRNASAPTMLYWTHMEKALRFIHENYAEPLYVEVVAKAVGLHKTRLQEMFRDALGMSCMLYLRAYRISQAKALLATSPMRIVEIAHATGFETLSNFNTSFRALVGMSPTQYLGSRQ